MSISTSRAVLNSFHTLIIAGCLLLLSACASPARIPLITAITPPATGTAAITPENVSALVETVRLAQGVMGPVTALAFTPDQTQLRVIHARTPVLRHWSLPERKLLNEYELASVGLGAAVFTGDARWGVLAGVANELAFSDDYLAGSATQQIMGPLDGITLLDAASGQVLDHLPRAGSGADNLFGVALSQNAKVVAARKTQGLDQARISLGRKSGLIVYALPASSSAPLSVLFTTPLYQSDFVLDFALDAESRLLAAYTENGLIQLWDLKSGHEWGKLKLQTERSGAGPEYALSQMAIAPNRQWLAAFSTDLTDPLSRQITLWELAGQSVQWQNEVDFRSVNAIAFNPGGSLLAVATSDGVHLWNAANGSELKVLHGGNALALAFSPDGSQLAWGDWAGEIHLVELPVK
jgi:WD40 repeat protein